MAAAKGVITVAGRRKLCKAHGYLPLFRSLRTMVMAGISLLSIVLLRKILNIPFILTMKVHYQKWRISRISFLI